jgi:hypothetical protein
MLVPNNGASRHEPTLVRPTSEWQLVSYCATIAEPISHSSCMNAILDYSNADVLRILDQILSFSALHS